MLSKLSHSRPAGRMSRISPPTYVRPINTMNAVECSAIASGFFARNARKAAEAMKNASNANIVDASGLYKYSYSHHRNDPSWL